VNQTARRLSPGLYILILIFFLMPFMDLSCGGQPVVTLSGIDMVTGKQLEDPGAYGGYGAEAPKIDPEPLAILALLAAGGGLILSFVKGKTGSVLAALVGAAGFVTMLLLKSRIDHQVLTEGEGLVTVEYRIGYWLVLLAFVVTAGLFAFFSAQPPPAEAAGQAFCMHCGAKNPARSTFCMVCGKRLQAS
jgi:hypothetical protein